MVRPKHVPYGAPKKKKVEGVKKKHKWHPGTQAVREIRRFQSRTDQLVPRAVVERLLREIAQELKEGVRFSKPAIDALHEISEVYVTGLLKDANDVAVKSGQVTLLHRHMEIALMLRKD